MRAGRLDTGLVERELHALVDVPVPARVHVAWALHRLLTLDTTTGTATDAATDGRAGDDDPWRTAVGDQASSPRRTTVTLPPGAISSTAQQAEAAT